MGVCTRDREGERERDANVSVCAYVLVCEGQRLIFFVFLDPSLLSFLRQGLSLNPEFTDLSNLAGQ